MIPLSEGWAIGDINVGVLYLFAISSLGVYGIIMAGWASNSKYPFLAALRSAAQMVSYEVSIGFVIITVLLRGLAESLDIINAQDTRVGIFGWYWLPLFPMFITSSPFRRLPRPTGRRSILLERNRTGRRLRGGIFGDAVPAVFPWQIYRDPDHVRDDDDPVPQGLAFADSVLPPFVDSGRLLVRAQSILRGFHVRDGQSLRAALRYDQLMRLGWKVFLPISLFMVVLVAGVLEATGWGAHH